MQRPPQIDARGNYLSPDHPLFSARIPPPASVEELFAMMLAGRDLPRKKYSPIHLEDMTDFLYPAPVTVKAKAKYH